MSAAAPATSARPATATRARGMRVLPLRSSALPTALLPLLLVAGCGQPAPQPAPASGAATGAPPSRAPSSAATATTATAPAAAGTDAAIAAAAAAADADAHAAASASADGTYAVDPAASLIAVTVRRSGPLARLGHDHVIAVRALTGRVAPGLDRADLAFRLDGMTVDEPQLLRAAGIATQPSAQAIAGTRHNMLGPVLDAGRYPVVTLHAARFGGDRLQVDVTLHGITRRLALPAAVHADDAQVTASGGARLQQTDFGITPFAVGAGLLAVDDALEVTYRIVARRRGGVPMP